MTQLRKQKDAISNHFDELLAGIGHRGSSFTDVDGLVHDSKTNRFLMLEFKQDGEELNFGQEWALEEFAKQPGCSVIAIWLTSKADQYRLRFYPEKLDDLISGSVLQRIVADWWNKPNERGTLDYRYNHLIDLIRAFVLAAQGNLAKGTRADSDVAARLMTALKIEIGF